MKIKILCMVLYFCTMMKSSDHQFGCLQSDRVTQVLYGHFRRFVQQERQDRCSGNNEDNKRPIYALFFQDGRYWSLGSMQEASESFAETFYVIRDSSVLCEECLADLKPFALWKDHY